MEKQKVIIDTDPGVDDSAAIILSLYDEFLDDGENADKLLHKKTRLN